jgi:hypothetical protein
MSPAYNQTARKLPRHNNLTAVGYLQLQVHSAAEPNNLQAAHWYLSQIISEARDKIRLAHYRYGTH